MLMILFQSALHISCLLKHRTAHSRTTLETSAAWASSTSRFSCKESCRQLTSFYFSAIFWDSHAVDFLRLLDQLGISLGEVNLAGDSEELVGLILDEVNTTLLSILLWQKLVGAVTSLRRRRVRSCACMLLCILFKAKRLRRKFCQRKSGLRSFAAARAAGTGGSESISVSGCATAGAETCRNEVSGY